MKAEILSKGIDPYMFPSKQKLIKTMFSSENVKKLEKPFLSSFFSMLMMLMLPKNKGKTMAIAKRVRILRDYHPVLIVLMMKMTVMLMLRILGAITIFMERLMMLVKANEVELCRKIQIIMPHTIHDTVD